MLSLELEAVEFEFVAFGLMRDFFLGLLDSASDLEMRLGLFVLRFHEFGL